MEIKKKVSLKLSERILLLLVLEYEWACAGWIIECELGEVGGWTPIGVLILHRIFV